MTAHHHHTKKRTVGQRLLTLITPEDCHERRLFRVAMAKNLRESERLRRDTLRMIEAHT